MFLQLQKIYVPFCPAILHSLLGIGNKAIKCVQEVRPGAYRRCCEKMNLAKDTYDFTGKKLKLVFSEPYLKELAICLDDDDSCCKAMIAYMSATLALYNTSAQRELDPETMIHIQVIDGFKEAFKKVHQGAHFLLSAGRVLCTHWRESCQVQ